MRHSTRNSRAVRRFGLGVLLCLVVATLVAPPVAADEGWAITSFDATYLINADGSIDVVEDIRVDFGSQQKHGILRDIPIEFGYDSEYRRLIEIDNITVDDGVRSIPFRATTIGADRNLRIGDANVFVSGRQRYRISYRLTGVLNAQDEWDELYWNVTGNGWPVRIESASAVVTAPRVTKVTCYQGHQGSTDECASEFEGEFVSAVAVYGFPGDEADPRVLRTTAWLRWGGRGVPLLVARRQGPLVG